MQDGVRRDEQGKIALVYLHVGSAERSRAHTLGDNETASVQEQLLVTGQAVVVIDAVGEGGGGENGCRCRQEDITAELGDEIGAAQRAIFDQKLPVRFEVDIGQGGREGDNRQEDSGG